jgi:murein L,D-transpeptidase YafK
MVADKVIVDKTKRKLLLLKQSRVFKVFDITLGGDPIGHKMQQGDKKTPEGHYTLDYKNPKSKFYRSIHISYPNSTDIKRARALGVSAGGDIMIHGQRNGATFTEQIVNRYRDWTAGCISVSNHDMDEIWRTVEAGTPIEIRP